MSDEPKIKWTDNLEPLSRFIATHGLAVFLVVYYATVLYPDAMKERAIWIEQITELRKAVDPDSRPVSLNQARIITDLVSDNFINKLKNEISKTIQQEDLLHLRVGQVRDSDGNEGLLAGNMALYIKADKPLQPQLDDINPKYNRFQLYVLREIGSHVDIVFEKVIKNAQSNIERLDTFNFSNGNLYDFWTSFYNRNRAWLKEKVTNQYAQDFLRENHRDYVKVLGQHKDYESGCEQPLPEGVVSDQSISEALQKILYKEIKEYSGYK